MQEAFTSCYSNFRKVNGNCVESHIRQGWNKRIRRADSYSFAWGSEYPCKYFFFLMRYNIFGFFFSSFLKVFSTPCVCSKNSLLQTQLPHKIKFLILDQTSTWGNLLPKEGVSKVCFLKSPMLEPRGKCNPCRLENSHPSLVIQHCCFISYTLSPYSL